MLPKISIITISFNSEKHIEEAIQSVLKQSYENVEYIIIDGKSTDKTMEIIGKYKDRIQYIISEPDKGISDAFNKGIKVASGDIIGIVNSDDKLYTNDALEKVARCYDSGFEVFRGSEVVRNFDTGYEYILHPTMKFKKNPITFHVCHMATYISREAFEKFGYYNTNLKYAMDLELLYRYNLQGAKSKKIDDIIGLFRIGGISQVYNKKKRNECVEIIKMIDGSIIDVMNYKISLIMKDLIRLGLNLFGIDVASRIRYGRKKVNK